MFQEILRAPGSLKQENMFRSPDVALLPSVGGSTQAVMTPLRTPGGLAALLAPAIVATVANKTTTAAASSFLDGDFITSLPLSCFVRGRIVRSSDRASAKLAKRLLKPNASPRSAAQRRMSTDLPAPSRCSLANQSKTIIGSCVVTPPHAEGVKLGRQLVAAARSLCSACSLGVVEVPRPSAQDLSRD